MKNYIILTDSRQKKEEHILKVFDEQNVCHIKTALISADYIALRYYSKKGFSIDYTVLIDTKKDLLEIANNLCNKSEHERIKKEIQKAKNLGCKYFIFLIGDNHINSLNSVKNWESKHTKVRGETLFKVMNTMKRKYKVNFIFCERKNMGSYILYLFDKFGKKDC